MWRQDVEFIASLYNIHLRRDQVNAVQAGVKSASFSVQQQQDIEKLSATNLIGTALASGDVNSVRGVLRKGCWTPWGRGVR